MVNIKTYSVVVGFLLSASLITGAFYSLPVWSQEGQAPETKASMQKGESATGAAWENMPKISVKRVDDADEASLYIDSAEVVRIRSEAGGVPPQDRIKIVADRLKRFLQKGGSPRDIKPGQEGSAVVIRAGQTVLITVDRETATKAKSTPKLLAFQWTNQIRQALGADPIERTVEHLASRGLSPALSELRQLPSTGTILKGFASWYGPYFHGRRTASGQRFNMYEMTAAHKTLPFNTLVRVTNVRTGQSAIVRITDRGPYIHGRIIDLSKAAAQAIGMLSSGTAPVIVEVLGR